MKTKANFAKILAPTIKAEYDTYYSIGYAREDLQFGDFIKCIWKRWYRRCKCGESADYFVKKNIKKGAILPLREVVKYDSTHA
jgi:hypothetical protein